MISFARSDTSLVSRWWWTIDRWMLLALGVLFSVGILLVLAASPAVADRLGLASFHFAQRQMVFLGLAMLIMFGFSLLTPLQIRRICTVMLPVFLLLILLTVTVGPEIKGASRWLQIGSFTLQPSEFMKPAFVVVCAWMFAEEFKNPAFPGKRIAAALFVIVATLLALQPDMGQTMLLGIVWSAQLFMAGLPVLWVSLLVCAGVAGGVTAYLTMPHVASRIDRFLDPSSGDTFQIDTALNAMRAGGLFGRGPGEGAVKRVLPDAHTDFIFAVAGEEFGTIAVLGILLLFAAIVIRGLARILEEQDPFVFLAATGLFILFGIQALINMAVNLALLPSKGMTLPFISYGGSSMLAIAITMGMILALTRRNRFLKRPTTLELGS